jgi:hypothetical protein
MLGVRQPRRRHGGDRDSPLDRSGMNLEIAKVFEDREWPGDWRVE